MPLNDFFARGGQNSPHSSTDNVICLRHAFFDASLHEAQFDGLDTRVFESFQRDAIPEHPTEIAGDVPLPDQVSILSDGSLLAAAGEGARLGDKDGAR
jgi:hypothetical protein